MKKLTVFALALASVGGAFAQCSPTAPVVSSGALVYNWKFTGKTTTAIRLTTTTSTSGSGCTPGTTSGGTNLVRVTGSMLFQGNTFVCTNSCGAFIDPTGWTSYDFWATKPLKSTINKAGASGTHAGTDPITSFTVIDVIGKKAADTEIYGTFVGDLDNRAGDTFTMNFAGFGKFSKGIYTTFCGDYVGLVNQVEYIGSNYECTPAFAFDCDNLTSVDTALLQSVAFGTWSCKYNKSQSTKYYKNGTYPSVPSWYGKKNIESI